MEHAADEKSIKAQALAADVMTLARGQLTAEFRFLASALSRLPPVSDGDVSLCVDGLHMYYGPWYILHRYRDEPACVPRDMLHSLLHCVFRHYRVGRDIDRARWDLACDAAVENAINDMRSPALAVMRTREQGALLDLLKSELGTLTAERIYKWLGDKEIPEEELAAQRECFMADGHGVWYGQFDKNAKQDKNIELKKIWEEVSKRMQTELETLERDRDSALVQNLRSLNRAKYDYNEFLRRFGVHGEVLRLSDEEFDNNYYAYGMELYGNVPLIEPLEYCEERRIREFVIAIDTSGSVRGDVVQSFIQHTHDMLQKRDHFFSKVNLHIIQCDDRIRDDALITDKESFERYIDTLEIKGLGRTDFRPVFSYVDELVRKGEMPIPQGLIYFTDGEGIYPSARPEYDTAFILHSDGYTVPEAPGWAISLVLSEEDILDKRFSAD